MSITETWDRVWCRIRKPLPCGYAISTPISGWWVNRTMVGTEELCEKCIWDELIHEGKEPSGFHEKWRVCLQLKNYKQQDLSCVHHLSSSVLAWFLLLRQILWPTATWKLGEEKFLSSYRLQPAVARRHSKSSRKGRPSTGQKLKAETIEDAAYQLTVHGSCLADFLIQLGPSAQDWDHWHPSR